VATATCRVMQVNDKRSVALAVMGDERFGALGLVAVGNVTIPANFAIPEAGSVCEVRYLYYFEGGSLYQPVYLGTRDDVEVDALSTLKRKAEMEA
jgi:bifunctional non-homologous end joining protein LigD